MKSNRIPLVLASFLALFLAFGIAPAYGASKEMIELQTQVTQLQQQMTAMTRSFDERMGIMKNLLEQNTSVANKVSAAIGELQTSVNKQQQDRSGPVSYTHLDVYKRQSHTGDMQGCMRNVSPSSMPSFSNSSIARINCGSSTEYPRQRSAIMAFIIEG